LDLVSTCYGATRNLSVPLELVVSETCLNATVLQQALNHQL
jgi:hypothetical protein